MSAGKYYAVAQGRKPGIYTNWADCQKQINGYSGAIYKSFKVRAEAEEYMKEHKSIKERKLDLGSYEAIAYVDGSYEESMGRYASGVVLLDSAAGTEYDISQGFGDKENLGFRNVAGEIRATIIAIDECMKRGYKSVLIAHDYEGIAQWANGTWKARCSLTQDYVGFIKNCRERIRIDFMKVEAHTGNYFNEKADTLAKRGLTASHRLIDEV